MTTTTSGRALLDAAKKNKNDEFYTQLEERVKALMADDENQKREAYERQNGVCPMCGEHFEFEEMDGDHIVPWAKGGKTEPKNCQMLCIRDNRSRVR